MTQDEIFEEIVKLKKLEIKRDLTREETDKLGKLEIKKHLTPEEKKKLIAINTKVTERIRKEIYDKNKIITTELDGVKLTRLESRIIGVLFCNSFLFVTRDKNGALSFWEQPPVKLENFWLDGCDDNGNYDNWAERYEGKRLQNAFSELFDFVKWEDKEPYSLWDLVNPYLRWHI